MALYSRDWSEGNPSCTKLRCRVDVRAEEGEGLNEKCSALKDSAGPLTGVVEGVVCWNELAASWKDHRSLPVP
jgi:hypothetical protein